MNDRLSAAPASPASAIPADAPLDRAGVNPLRDALIDAGLLIPTGVQGLFGRSERFERVVEALDAFVTRIGADQQAEVLRFPPAMSRAEFERSEYMKSFPQLAGTVHAFCGGEHEQQRVLQCLERGDDWTGSQKPTYVVMTPAACYPVYPVVARAGALPGDGRLVDVFSYCFRHEPSLDPTRMQLFRMREYVRIGTPEQIVAFRRMWMERGARMIDALRLPNAIDLANDPFFGRGGKIVADSQREQNLKFELLVPIEHDGRQTACLSFNYHMDHFGLLWGIRTATGDVAHTGCVGFGLERLTLALFRHHGFDLDAWPRDVRDVLWGDR
ncbi:amino acid--[acyl-carrier-protein] ligase [Burkholderia ubonensis]|uniref:amino acid--[acyl-carrier-protein] ligase n=1 Tax=Burkholderia ubonensis TaxID=101571 RepID=UPI000BA5F642|nr:amino acid--[acyl-carrier-protein] ligase [Burkholderia ubonensis]PAK15346.1 amino acid--[acyl-carrier-protein] ligase [Burkholderia ubonensis]RQP35988.1 amino acid--[acyl-carrier-protein] ligase [Burkholderia ubonensis]RQP37580.1 amino acid--[acyl-carrier-protein] ligase [Burkholderia ubonensis]RQP41951.1 amino acid--[acyl-carrier-protein] ligase [Burkholderia ubonensis]RQP55167.1 amino acid--[acyl-carrier-protein] ligase [Burkholderia ubonensis]